MRSYLLVLFVIPVTTTLPEKLKGHYWHPLAFKAYAEDRGSETKGGKFLQSQDISQKPE